MLENNVTVQFCGFGGQGIILSSVILGSAAVTKAGLYAVQTQSYGSEARGGECQAEVIIGKGPIDSTVADQSDILVAMSQSALKRYLPRLKPGGTLFYDAEYIDAPEERRDIRIHAIPATRIAAEEGTKLAANMVALGFIQQATGLFQPEDLFAAIRENVREGFIAVNLKAAQRGMDLAREQGVRVEI